MLKQTNKKPFSLGLPGFGTIRIDNQGVENQLNGFEQIINLYLEPKMFAQVGVLTETQKMQRHVAKVHYKDIIQNLYEEEKA